MTIAKSTDAITLLKNDHRTVKALFDQFKKAGKTGEKAKIVAEAIMELKIHTVIEEEIFYPAVRKALNKAIGKKDSTALMDEADEEHHVAKLLIAELDTMQPGDDHWEGKFTVLSENIVHHVKEEEGELFPEARKLDIDFDALGAEMLARKEALKTSGNLPPFAEQGLIAKGGVADSPMENAKTFA